MAGFFFVLLSAFVFSANLQASENPLIRVRMESSAELLQLEGAGLQVQARENDPRYEFVAIPQNKKIQIERVQLGGQPVWKITRGSQIEIRTEPIVTIQGHDIRSKGKLLPNHLFLSSKKNRFDLIAVLPLEDYLIGVIASEMPLSWPMETLKAQAIAARSYALATIKERAKQPFHVESTILDQVFSHIGSGPDESPLIQHAKAAVRATEGQILLNTKSQALKAFYHSDCGGKTSDAKQVWGSGNPTGSVKDPSCPSRPQAHWKLELSEEALGQRLQKYLKNSNLGNLQALQLIRPSAEDRVEKMRLSFEDGEELVIPAQDFRAAIGFDQLKSTFFQVKKIDEKYQFIGQGFGHGVGLCQWGARHLGKSGQSYSEILNHYYPKAVLSLRSSPEREIQTR
ncbi:MAG: SpoIID/LytB domain-containing protein [Pseudobdellovibrionaceae bacterium]